MPVSPVALGDLQHLDHGYCLVLLHTSPSFISVLHRVSFSPSHHCARFVRIPSAVSLQPTYSLFSYFPKWALLKYRGKVLHSCVRNEKQFTLSVPHNLIPISETSKYLSNSSYFLHSLLLWSFPFFLGLHLSFSPILHFSSCILFPSYFFDLLCGNQAHFSFVWYCLAWL